MISPVNNSTFTPPANNASSVKPPAPPPKPNPPQDTVQLSQQAKQSGDVDHDGDSH